MHRYLFIYFLLCMTRVLDATPIDLGVLKREDTLPLSITCTGNSTALSAAKRAFKAHGAIRLASSPEAQWFLELHPNADGVLAVLKDAKHALWQVSLKGGSLVSTTLRACDWALELMHPGLRGIFSTEMAFVSDLGQSPGKRPKRELFWSTLFFDTVEQLTHFSALVLTPSLSPNHQKILYTSDHRSGFLDVFEYDRRSSASRLIAGYQGSNLAAVYSPKPSNGVAMALILSHHGSPMPYFADAQGKQLQCVVPAKPAAICASPSFSPDGQQVVFVSNRLGGKPQLYVQKMGSRQPPKRLLTRLSNSCLEPCWNPVTPNLIAFIAPTAGQLRIGIYDFKKSNADWVPLSLPPGHSAVEFQWCRDGRHGVYTRRSSSKQVLHLIDTLSGKDTPLTPGDFKGSTFQAALF